MSKVIGIDLGTTNSVVGYVENGEAFVIPNSRGERITPSVVAFTKEKEILVGKVAKNQAITNSERTISSVKREMGSDFRVDIDDKKYSPEEVSAIILRRLKKDAEEYLGEELKQAVITVPAYFNDSQREATIKAGKIAGLDVLRIINEPTAAALAFGLHREDDCKIAVFDLGGGTYDVSILEIGGGVFQVLATSGDNYLGGDDFDKAIVDYLVKTFHEEEGVDLSQDAMSLQRVRDEAVRAKIELSEAMLTRINIPFITADANGPKHLDEELTRSKFEELIEPYLKRLEEPALRAMKDADVAPEEIDKVILVGGSTRIPVVQECFQQIINKEFFKGINPDECVAMGAAIQASNITEKTGLVLVDVTPLTLGIEIEGGVFAPIIPRNTPIPCSKTRMFTTIGDNQTTVEVKIFQGERKKAEHNKLLGNFTLTGIRLARKGEPKIEVKFEIDVDGVVHVSAQDLDTNQKQEIRITGSSSLSDQEVDRLVKEAQEYEETDEYFIKLANAKNEADKLIIQAKRTLEVGVSVDADDDIADTMMMELEDAIIELERLRYSEDPNTLDDLNSHIDVVQTIMEQIESM